jgi:outer membrane protein TolC
MRQAVPVILAAFASLWSLAPSPASAVMTADDAVKIALQKSGDIVRADASVLSARSGLWGAYSFVLPSVTLQGSRGGASTRESRGSQAFGSAPVPNVSEDFVGRDGSWGFSGRWAIFDPSGIVGLSSARAGMKGADLGHKASRADVRLAAKQRFYTTVKAMHLARVQARALRLARDDERRVRALFEVGSVSKSDLLKAQVRTASAQLDSTLSDHDVVTTRLLLAGQLGIPEAQLGEIDSTLSNEHATLDPTGVLDEARKNRPDLQAAEANVKSAELALRSAHFARLPSVVLDGAYTPKSVSSSNFTRGVFDLTTGAFLGTAHTDLSSTEKTDYRGRILVSMPIFDGFAIDSRVAAARGQMLSARETRDALLRNLEGEVHQSLLSYQEATERESLSRRAVESASENLNLIQQKYNVGSATILDLIDAQVQLQRSASELVSALADIKVAEALVDRVRGKGE